MAFRYQKRSYADAKERINSSGGYDTYIKSKYKVYKVKDGKNLIRILPPTWPKAKHYGYSVFLNYGVGPDNATYLSLSKMLGKPDPLAEARAEANRAGDEDLTKQLEARERVLMWIIDRDAEDEGPQVFACPKTVDADVLSISVEDDTQELVEIDHPEEGQDLRFYREGKGLNTKYPAAKMRLIKPSPINEDEKLQTQWLEYIEANPLPDCLNFYDYDHISNVYNGPSEEKPQRSRKAEPEDEEVEENPKPRSSRREEPADEEPEPEEKPRRTWREEPEEEAEPEEKPRRVTKKEPEPEDEEVEEKPRARTRTRLKDPEPEDEEAEEKPKKPGKGSEDEGMSIRERLRQRRQKANDDDE